MDRKIQIDTLRGLACFLLVGYHVIGGSESLGLRLSGGIYKELNEVLIYLRMPLFTFLSGIVYSYNPFSGATKNYLLGKMKRLLIPLIVVGTTFALIRHFTPGANTVMGNWFLLHIRPVGHFWFLEAIFIIFVIMIPLEKLKVFSSLSGAGIVLLISFALYISPIHIKYFAISGAIYLLPFFIVGMCLHRFKLLDKLNYKNGILFLLISIALFLYIKYTLTELPNKRSSYGFILGVCSCISLISFKFTFTWFAKIGVYSYSIYLYHVFFTALSRILLIKIWVINTHILFLFGLLLGITGPILIDIICSKNKMTSLMLLGKKVR